MFLTAVFCVILGTIAIFLLTSKRKLKNFPPGPSGLPIVGNVHQLGIEPHQAFIELRKKYGDIFSVTLGSYRAIILSDTKHIKEAFSAPAFAGRPFAPHQTEPETGLIRGVIFSKGEAWQEQRRFALKNLRDFGFGKKSMEVLVRDEVNELIEGLAKDSGKPIRTNLRFNVAVVNALWTIVSGERFHHNDPKLISIISLFSKNVTNSRTQGSLIFFPWYAKYFPVWSGCKDAVSNMSGIYDMMKSYLKSHKETYQDGVVRDLIDKYLEEMNRTSDSKSSFYKNTGDSNLVMTIFDLFVAGTETTSTTLSWMCLLLAHNPEVQEKLNGEINKIVGNSRAPSLTDRPSMPYTEAVITEVLRWAAIIPLGVFHLATEDTKFQGYTIPKDTIVIANQYAVLHDPKVWGDPENFRPERFISEDGKSVIRHESLIPFSIGKRVCPGESLARDELFLFSTAIFQRFKFGFVPNTPIPPLSAYPGAPVMVPLPHELLLEDRFN